MILQIAILFFVFLAALCIGSFLNVVIHRLPRGESIVHPRSRCPACSTPIPWYRNIPILSYLVQKGRCAACAGKISPRYPLVEALTAILLTYAAYWDPVLLHWPFHFYFLSALVACTFIDLDHWILPDKITLPGIVIGFVGSFFLPLGPIASLLGILVGGGVLYLVAWAYLALAKREGLGGGDIKFLAMVGAFLGVEGALVTLIFASMTGSVLGLFLIAARGKKGNTALPFGPFLASGAALAFFYARPFWIWYFNLH